MNWLNLKMRYILASLGWLSASMGMADGILVQSTTSTKNSGLYDHLLPEVESDLGFDVRVVAVGTGQAIRNAWNCDGDVLLVHAKTAEDAFVRDGGGVFRRDLMYNDFVIVGPQSDPAGIKNATDVTSALQKISESRSIFASRGDDSGTHKKEIELWSLSGVDPSGASGTWYRETGSGMGTTLNTGIGMSAYVLTDRATWLTFRNKHDFAILFEGDPSLFNQYGIILVDPKRCPNVDQTKARAFIDWMVSDKGRDAISRFEISGQQLFFPNAQ